MLVESMRTACDANIDNVEGNQLKKKLIGRDKHKSIARHACKQIMSDTKVQWRDDLKESLLRALAERVTQDTQMEED